MADLIIASFAVYAIVRTVSREDGPFNIFERLRLFAQRNKPTEPTTPEASTEVDEEWEEYDKELIQYEKMVYFWKRSLGGTIEGVVTCPYCLSWYVALPITIVTGGIYWYSLISYVAVVGITNLLLIIEDK